MFSGITGYLFGNSSADDCAPNSKNVEVNLQTTETEDDWLLVNASKSLEDFDADSDIFEDKSSSAASLCGYEEEFGGDIGNVDREKDLHLSMTVAISPSPVCNGESGAPSIASPAPSTPTSGASLEGSWYITPPPCFMLASGATVETSPMENLLIEHPSMSVYGPPRTGTKRPASVSTDAESSSNEGSVDLPVIVQILPKEPMKVKQAAEARDAEPLRPQLVPNDAASAVARERARVAAILADVVGVTTASQRGRQQGEKKYVGRNQMGRQNKVQENRSYGQRQRRKDRIKNPSGMNNNRRC